MMRVLFCFGWVRRLYASGFVAIAGELPKNAGRVWAQHLITHCGALGWRL